MKDCLAKSQSFYFHFIQVAFFLTEICEILALKRNPNRHAGATMNTASSIQNHPYYITEKQAASLTSIPVKTLQGMRIKGNGIPFIKIGRSVRYDLATIHKFMQQQTKTSTSQE